MRRTAIRCLVLAVLLCACSGAAAETVWFVVSEHDEPVHGDSFLVPLSDPEHIADARRLIDEGIGSGVGGVVTLRIAAGGDGYNRDVLRGGIPWSWHVSEFTGFADLAIELCDGWPSFIESDVEGFIANTGGAVCFWGYTITAELETPPAFTAMVDGLDGAWYDPQTSGQGAFVDVMPHRGELGLGWFAWAPGAPGTQRWWVAQGGYSGTVAELTLYASSGGAFGADDPVATEPAGMARLTFFDCNSATFEYAFDDGSSGTVALQRVAHMPGCVRR